MGFGHGHGHGAQPVADGHAAARYQGRMAITFGLVATFFVVELVAALWSGSLALLSDAGHMAADVVALGAALAATRLALRPDRTGRRSYGNYRAEVLAAGFTVLIMLGTGGFILVEAVRRIGEPQHLQTTPMLVVGTLGLVVNVISLLLLHAGSRESLNVRGAYLEVLADAAGSVAVVVAAILVIVTGSTVWDLVVAVGLAVFVLTRAVPLGREVLRVLAQHSPAGMDTGRVGAALAAVPGVSRVHDVHLWTLTSGMNVATAHLVTEEEADSHAVLAAAQAVMREEFDIEHATLQVEPPSHHCVDLSW